jgi:hypothetical protein
MYLAGHRQPATTARYLRPQLSAAEEVLAAAQAHAVAPASAPRGPGTPPAPAAGAATEEGFWLQSGCRAEPASDSEAEVGPEIASDFDSVRGGGIEPPWLSTASTSRARERANHWIVWESERQRTSGNRRKRPIPVAATGIRTGRYRVRARSRRRRMASPKGPRRASVRSAPFREGPWARTLNVIATPRGTGSRRDREGGARIADPSGAMISIPRTEGPSRRKVSPAA